jgi:hypothetical protein
MKKTEENKALLIEQIKKTPIIQIACEKSGIGRATFYRWMKEEEGFADAVQEAIREGKQLVNDLAESQLIAAIREKNMAAISFWLRHHHAQYSQKIELTGNLNLKQEALTPEEEALVRKVLESNL